MERDKLLAAWQHGVRLRDAWYTFAMALEQRMFLELESEGLHLEFVQSLKDKLIDQLYTEELHAFGVENKSDNGPIHIPADYFLKAAKIDWDKDAVAALGKEFHNVRVQAEREQADESFLEAQPADPGRVDPELEPVLDLTANRQSPPKPRGRPSKTPEIEQAIDILLKKGVRLAKLPRPEAMAEIKDCAANELNSDTNTGFSEPVIERVLYRRFGPRR